MEPTQKPVPKEIYEYAQLLYEEGVDENEIRQKLADRGYSGDVLDEIKKPAADSGQEEKQSSGIGNVAFIIIGILMIVRGAIASSEGIPPAIWIVLGIVNIGVGIYQMSKAR